MSPPDAPEPLTPAPALVERFRADLSRLCDVERDRVLVAVSGGPDSVALLLLARAVLGDRCRAATVDHGVRPAAAAEAAFVARLCAAYGIAHATLGPVDPEDDRQRGNLSDRLRLLRYALLRVELDEAGADWLLTAHHADDQMETVIMRLNRGSGVSGLAGVRERQSRLLRPLLGWRRAELAAVVAACGITPVSDPSNADLRFDRARLRHDLTGVGWLDPVRIARSAKALSDAEDALAWAAEAAASRCCDVSTPGEASLRPAGLPFELRRRLVLRCLRRVQPKAAPRGGEVAALVERLDRGEAGTLADVAVSVEAAGWHFRPAPPRRSL